MSKEDQPISSVTWVKRETLQANDYNPNKMAKTELGLLKTSIMEDGWTQPIVARLDGEIVDGFHRWTVSANKDVSALTDGYVPVVFIKEIDPARQRMATIRHNRARGEHYVMSMADIVAELVNVHGLDLKEIQRRLGMEKEEVMRLLDRGEMVKRAGNDEYKQGWVAEKR